MSTIPIDDKLVIGPDRANIDARYKASNNRPYTSVAAAEAAINLVIGNVGLTVLVADENDPDYPKAKEYWVQPYDNNGVTAYHLVEKGAGTTDYNDLENKPTISDGGQGSTQIPLTGNVKVTATAATSGQTTGVAVTAENGGGITMAFTLEKGADGVNGTNGTNGIDGKSAYQQWLDEGNTGDETDFLNSLKAQIGKFIYAGYNATAAALSIGGTTTESLATGATNDSIVLMPNNDATAGTGNPTATMMFSVSVSGDQTPVTTYTYIGDVNVDASTFIGTDKIVQDLRAGGTGNVPSAEAVKTIAETTMELVEPLNILNPADIKIGRRIASDGNEYPTSSTPRIYGCTDYIEIGDGVICNKSINRAGFYRGAAVYDADRLFIGTKSTKTDGGELLITKDMTGWGDTAATGADTEHPYYVTFNLYNPASAEGGAAYDGVTDGYAVYRATELPTPAFQPYHVPYWKQKAAPIQDGAVTTDKIADSAVTLDKISETEYTPVTDNICNPEECVFDGKYVNGNNGRVSTAASTSYSGHTGYIPIDERGVYCNGSKTGGLVIGYAYYSEMNESSYIDGYYKGHYPEGCTKNYAAYIVGAKYVRFSIGTGYDATNIMANIGSKELPYVAYGGWKKTISREILPTDNVEKILNEKKIYPNLLKVALPDKFYAVRGDIIQLFHKEVVYAIDFANRYVMPTCSEGTQYRRYFELDATKVSFEVSSSVSAAVGDVYSTQGNTYKVIKVETINSTTKFLTCTFKGAATVPPTGTLTKIQGDGDVSIAYTEFIDTVAAGEYPYSLTIYDDNGNVLGTGSSILKVVEFPTTPNTKKNILCVGASTTAGGKWVCEAQRRLLGTGVNPVNPNSPKGDGLDATKIKFIGSMTKELYGQIAGFYAKSGLSWEDYATKGRYAIRFYLEGTNRVTIGAKYTNNGHTYEVIELNTIDGVETIRCSTAEGNLPSPHGENVSGTLRKSSGNGDNTLIYNKSEVDGANPFWNSALATPALDFQNYIENICGETGLDMMIVVLGTNDMFKKSIEQQEEYVRLFVEACHADYPDCKIILVGSSIPSMINMMPGYGAGGDQFGNTYLVKRRLLDVFEMYKSVADEYENVEYESWAGQWDTDYNYPLTQKAVNTRNNAVTEPYANNKIHPGDAGYMQFADAAYRSIVAHLCQSSE